MRGEPGDVGLEDRDGRQPERPGRDGAVGPHCDRGREMHDVGSEVVEQPSDPAGRQANGELRAHRHRDRAQTLHACSVMGVGSVAGRDDHGVVTALDQVPDDAIDGTADAVHGRKERLRDDRDAKCRHRRTSLIMESLRGRG